MPSQANAAGRYVDSQFLNEIIGNLQALPTLPQKLAEFYKMYTDPNYQFYADFDQYPGTYNVTYFSAEEGGLTTDSVFSSFGNWAYGAIGIAGGIPKEYLTFAADWMQQGQSEIPQILRRDDPHDAINVDLGIQTATNYIFQGGGLPTSLFSVGPPLSPTGTNVPDGIEGGSSADTIHGLVGNDWIYGGAGADGIYGDDGSDVILGDTGADNLIGGLGGDLVSGGEDNDVILGNEDNDRLFGDNAPDWIEGNAGDDVIFGGAGNDAYAYGTAGLFGGDGNDAISGGDGYDQASGNDGNDLLSGGTGNDLLIGDNAAINWVYNSGTWVPQVSAFSGTGNDEIYGNDNNDTIYGGAGSDTLQGNAGLDTINGNAGDDFIYGGQDGDWLAGGQDNDTIRANLGNDYLTGDLGNDHLYGEGGADTFATSSSMNVDRVYDFNSYEGDRVQVLSGAYSVYQSGSDTIIDFGNGSQMQLVGTPMSALQPGWII